MSEERDNIGLVSYELHGRTPIIIPEKEITKEILNKYLFDTIMPIFTKNKSEFDILDRYYRGIQKIAEKEKEIRTNINNKPMENHALEITEFWKGYMTGRPLKYAQIVPDKLTDDIGMLNTYMLDQQKSKKDGEIWKWLALGGNAFYMCLPKENNDYEIDKEAPFKLIQCDPRWCGVIRSSFIGNKVLGGFVITKIDKQMWQMVVYAPRKRFTIKVAAENIIDGGIVEEDTILSRIPVIEYMLNESRYGIVESIIPMLDTLNFITANQLDDVQQFVNNLMIFKNVNITKEILEQMEEMKIIKINSPNPQVDADIKILQQSLNHSDIQVLYDRIYNRMMAITATPKASDRATSGGDTGQARLLGEGWTLADQRAMTYQNTVSGGERDLLDIILYICRTHPNCKIDKLYPSDIDIKFSRSKSDNMLVKSQVILNLQAAGLPEEIITQVSELFDADLEVANAWKKNLAEKQAEQDKREQKQIDVQIEQEKQETINNMDNRAKGQDTNE